MTALELEFDGMLAAYLWEICGIDTEASNFDNVHWRKGWWIVQDTLTDWG